VQVPARNRSDARRSQSARCGFEQSHIVNSRCDRIRCATTGNQADLSISLGLPCRVKGALCARRTCSLEPRGLGRLIRASTPKRNWERAAVMGSREGGFASGEGIARGRYVLQRILKYFNCSGSRNGTLLAGFIRDRSIESMNRD